MRPFARVRSRLAQPAAEPPRPAAADDPPARPARNSGLSPRPDQERDAPPESEPAPPGDPPPELAPASPPESAFEDDPDASPTEIPWRRNLTAIWVVQILAIVGFSLRAPFLPFYLTDLGVDTVDGQTLWSGLINAGGAGVMALTAPIWGVVADRHGRRMMLLRASFAGACTVALMSLATSPWQLLGLRLVEGALTGTVTAATVLVATTTPRARLGFALGMLQTAIFAGASIGPLVGGLLADRIGPRPTFLVAGSLLAAAGVMTVLLVREKFVPTPRTTIDESAALSRWARIRRDAAPLFGPVVVTLIVALFAIRFAAMAVQPIVPLFVAALAPGAADPASLAGVVLGILGVTSALSAVVLGRFGDRRGHRAILVACVAAAGLLYLPMALAGGPWQLAALQGAFGFAAGGMIPAANALVADHTPAARRATMYGITSSAAALGAFIGPLAGAALAVAVGFRATFLAVGVLLLALAVVVARGVPRGEPRNRGVEESKRRTTA
jgi:DHA1 family multidrug resistance protein-like MFS transporter